MAHIMSSVIRCPGLACGPYHLHFCIPLFLRVRAIFFASRAATASFFLLWLGVLGSCVQVPYSFRVSLVGDAPQLCKVTEMGAACISCLASALIFDTIVLFSLSWKILHLCAEGDTWDDRFAYFISRLRLPYVSESVLRGSQKYYVCVWHFIHDEK